MLFEVALGGWSALTTLRRFRSEHELLRRNQALPADPYRLQVERTALALGLEPLEVEMKVQEWMLERPGKWLKRFRRVKLLEEMSQFRLSGGRLALVSDYPARKKLRALGCEDLFDAVVANGEEGGPRWLKPHPDGLLSASARLGVTPERCLVLGDRADADGVAAQRAGMDFRQIT